MDLYIKVLTNRPTDHPITRENMESAFPYVDLDNLPSGWAKFIRVPCPRLEVYETAESAYDWDGDVIKDVWYIHQMSEDEKRQKQERVKQMWKLDNGPENWIFDEITCTHKPPKDMPNDGKQYIWVQAANNWVEVEQSPLPLNSRPPYPTDGRIYNYNESNNTWVVMN